MTEIQSIIRILGPVRIRAGTTWLEVSAGKPRTLLALLALSPGRVLSMDRLTAELWTDRPPRFAANQIHGYVARLRRLICDPEGERLRTAAPGYELAVEPRQIDEGHFEALAVSGLAALRSGDPERAARELAQALALWRGPALADVQHAPVFVVRIAALEERRLTVLEAWADAVLLCGRYAEVVPRLREAANEHPHRESLWLRLMRGLAGSGRAAEALGAYGLVQNTLSEIGLEPGPELLAFRTDLTGRRRLSPARFGQALAQPEREPAGRAVCQLPADLADFTGREEEQRAVARLLERGGEHTTPPLAAIVGEPGAGKTALAVRVAHRLRETYPDGQLYVKLGGSSAADVLEEMIVGLGGDPARIPSSVDARAAYFRTWVADRRILILLDDAESVAQLRPLLPGTGSAAALVTSRHALAELPSHQRLVLAPFPMSDALALLSRIIGPARMAGEPVAARDIAERCARLPLAVRIAGGRLAADPIWRLERMAERLAPPWQRLDVLRLGDLDVRRSIDRSYRLLSPPAARALRLLAIIGPNEFAAWAIGTMLDQPGDDVLQELVDAHLIQSIGRDPLGWLRFRLPDLVRIHARERVDEDPTAEQDQALRRMMSRGAWEVRARSDEPEVMAAWYALHGPFARIARDYALERGWDDVAGALADCVRAE